MRSAVHRCVQSERCEVHTRVCMQTGVADGKTLVDVVAMTATEDHALKPAGHTAPRAASRPGDDWETNFTATCYTTHPGRNLHAANDVKSLLR